MVVYSYSRTVFKRSARAMVFASAIAFSGCNDAEIAAPTDTSSLKYNFHVSGGGSEFGEVQAFLMQDEFRVNDNGIAQSQYTGKYNGCVRMNAVFSDSEAEMFTFINWSITDDQLIIDLNLSPEPDWTMVIGNDDGGRLEAVIAGTTSDGVRHEYLYTGSSPTVDDGEICVKNANAT